MDSGHTHQTVQDVLDGLVVLERSREDGETRFNINSLKHLKSFFSGAFRLALQQEYDEGRNPVRETSLPKARGPEDTYAYSLEEILAMIEVVPEPASSVIATAAFAGARRGEIRGMFCENYRDCAMQIARCVWNGHVTDPKSAKSKGAIPIISRLASKLNAYRARQGNPISGPMFPNDAEKPMDLNNLLNRVDPASPGRLRTMPGKQERSQQGRLRFQA